MIYSAGYILNTKTPFRSQSSVSIYAFSPKLTLNPKPLSSITSVSAAQLFWNFAQSTAVSLPGSVQNYKTIWDLRDKSQANEILRDLSGTMLCSIPLLCLKPILCGSLRTGPLTVRTCQGPSAPCITRSLGGEMWLIITSSDNLSN